MVGEEEELVRGRHGRFVDESRPSVANPVLGALVCFGRFVVRSTVGSVRAMRNDQSEVDG